MPVAEFLAAGISVSMASGRRHLEPDGPPLLVLPSPSMATHYAAPVGVPLLGVVTDYSLTMSGFQITTIDGVKYATLWDARAVGPLSTFVGSTRRRPARRSHRGPSRGRPGAQPSR